jgi:hypothetical protein
MRDFVVGTLSTPSSNNGIKRAAPLFSRSMGSPHSNAAIHKSCKGCDGGLGGATVSFCPSMPHSPERNRRMASGVTIVEVMVSAVVIFIGLGSIFSLNTQSLRILRKTRQYSSSNQVLVERIEMLRNHPWPDVSRGQTLAGLFQSVVRSSRDLADAQPVEDILVSVPATPGNASANPATIEVRRQNGIAVVVCDGDLSNEPLLLVDLSISWRDANGISQREIRTIIARNGLTRSGVYGSILGRPAINYGSSP